MMLDVDGTRRILSMDMLKFEGYIQIHDGEDARWSNPNIIMLNSWRANTRTQMARPYTCLPAPSAGKQRMNAYQ
jgi:hypothetical protein